MFDEPQGHWIVWGGLSSRCPGCSWCPSVNPEDERVRDREDGLSYALSRARGKIENALNIFIGRLIVLLKDSMKLT